MKPLRSVVSATERSPWVCQACIRRQHERARSAAFYSTTSKRVHMVKTSTRGIALSTAAGLGAGSIFYLPENSQQKVQHAYAATQRTGRVLTTLATCINE